MGSFYTLCSITNKTISDGDEMVIQFMLPSKADIDPVESGNMFVDIFLEAVKKEGVEKALATWTEATKRWSPAGKCGEKGMIVSNEGAIRAWIPFGPAIRGTYNDCGDIEVSTDEENKRRIEILEAIFCGIPFDSIMGLATDDRWYTIGLAGTDPDDEKNWGLKGVDKKLPGFILDLCKDLSVTYFHASVYDEVKQFDFSPEEGKMVSKYEIKWKKEYIDKIKKSFPKKLELIKKKAAGILYELNDIGVFRNMKKEHSLVYLASLYREKIELEWFYEQLSFLYSLNGLLIELSPSQYGSQHLNWKGWKRIYQKLDPILETKLKKWGYDEETEEEEELKD